MKLELLIVIALLPCGIDVAAQSHNEGTANGTQANAVVPGFVTKRSAESVVPGYATTPAETAYTGRSNLSADADAKLAACAKTPSDPTCEALRSAVDSANTPRPAVGATDPAVRNASSIYRNPSSQLGSLAAYYSDCTAATKASGCPSNVACIGTSCFNTSYTSDADFARSATLLEAAREAGSDLDAERMRIFVGAGFRCRDRSFTDCCDSNPDRSFCNDEEMRLALKEEARLCHSVGSYCSTCVRVLGKCVACTERTTGKCCFNSMLARLISEQGREQIGKGWGDARSPDCSGFTVAQLQSLDFAKMDLSEFYATLAPKSADLARLQGRSASRVQECYYGQGRCQ